MVVSENFVGRHTENVAAGIHRFGGQNDVKEQIGEDIFLIRLDEVEHAEHDHRRAERSEKPE